MRSIEKSLALRFKNSVLEILDQTLLPSQEVWIKISHPQEMVAAIRELKVRGAPLIGVAAALSLGEWAKSQNSPEQVIEQALALRESRPTAVNLMISIDRMLKKVPGPIIGREASDYRTWHSSWQSDLADEAWAIFEEDLKLCDQIAGFGSELIHSGDGILTHCNTGALATAGVGTALGVIRKSFDQKKNNHVYVDETRPLLQGARLTTFELEKLKIPYTLICDSMAGFLMAQGKVQLVIVGADRIAANGDFANKVGTYSLAILASYHQIPFYVAAPFTTVDPLCESGRQIPIEERKNEEVLGVKGSFGEVAWAPKTAKTYNPAFDVTPNSLVTAWITDRGIYRKQDIGNAVFGFQVPSGSNGA